MISKILFLGSILLLIAGCGSNNDCPNGVNTTNPNCSGYVAPQNYAPNQQVPCQPGTPNCVNGYYQQYPQQQACQPGTPNCVNGYYQYPQQQTCQPGTPNCVNGYYQYPQTYPYTQQPYPQQYPYGYPRPNYPYYR